MQMHHHNVANSQANLSMEHRALRGLYAITPETLDTAHLCAQSAAVLAGGARVLQYRSKLTQPQLREEQAHALAALCKNAGAIFIVNDDVPLALACDADGVHLGRDDGDLASARQRIGSRRLLGVSCYNQRALAQSAQAAGADYVAFGSVFSSSTKPAAVRAPLTLFSQARSLTLPLVAIGGITLETAGEVIDAGADCLAVISDVFDAPDPKARARAYSLLFQSKQP